ncbi:hypothetical protein ACLF3G_23770 [Falsiroseomonas sp. HC035]|uniref:hypothetical protein n=1 Tax=Falsiroseomonas sp. HC035 TaxID=3390999 RepID=UPI003D31A1B8
MYAFIGIEHRDVAMGCCRRDLVLQHVPMPGRLAILKAEKIDDGLVDALRQVGNECAQHFAPLGNVGLVLDVVRQENPLDGRCIMTLEQRGHRLQHQRLLRWGQSSEA